MQRNYGDHKVPEPFKDEDKWLMLTKRQIVILLPIVVLCGTILIKTFEWHIFPIGIMLSVALMVLAGAFILIKIPDDKYLLGSGLKLEVIVIRIVKKKLPKNKVVYCRFYDNGYKEWLDK